VPAVALVLVQIMRSNPYLQVIELGLVHGRSLEMRQSCLQIPALFLDPVNNGAAIVPLVHD